MSIVVVGSLNIDSTFKVPRIPRKGETILALSKSVDRGGKGQNQAVSMARLGANVTMIGSVGNDDDGRWMKKSLAEESVNNIGVVEKNISTGMASIYLDKDGNNNIVVYPGANFELSILDIKNMEDIFKNAKFCVMQFEIPLDVIYYCLDYCFKNNIKTILNPAPMTKDFNLEYLKYVDYLIPNETELELLAGEDLSNRNLDKLASKVLNMGCKNLIVTLGEKGSKLYKKDFVHKVEAKKVKAVDTTAAGDSYIGGFTTALSKGLSVEEAMKFATKVSAITVTKGGAISSMPFVEEI